MTKLLLASVSLTESVILRPFLKASRPKTSSALLPDAGAAFISTKPSLLNVEVALTAGANIGDINIYRGDEVEQHDNPWTFRAGVILKELTSRVFSPEALFTLARSKTRGDPLGISVGTWVNFVWS